MTLFNFIYVVLKFETAMYGEAVGSYWFIGSALYWLYVSEFGSRQRVPKPLASGSMILQTILEYILFALLARPFVWFLLATRNLINSVICCSYYCTNLFDNQTGFKDPKRKLSNLGLHLTSVLHTNSLKQQIPKNCICFSDHPYVYKNTWW